MLAKFLKDSFCKYQTMKGKRVLRKIGLDTHGLPIEVNVEKKLGFSGKGDIEKYGIKDFNEKCRESVWKNEKAFTDFTNKMGQFIDLKNPYVTYNNDLKTSANINPYSNFGFSYYKNVDKALIEVEDKEMLVKKLLAFMTKPTDADKMSARAEKMATSEMSVLDRVYRILHERYKL